MIGGGGLETGGLAIGGLERGGLLIGGLGDTPDIDKHWSTVLSSGLVVPFPQGSQLLIRPDGVLLDTLNPAPHAAQGEDRKRDKKLKQMIARAFRKLQYGHYPLVVRRTEPMH